MKKILAVVLVFGSISSFAQPYTAREGDRLSIVQSSKDLQPWDTDTRRATIGLREECQNIYGGSLVGSNKCEVLNSTASDGYGGRIKTRKAFCSQMCKF